MYVVPAGESYCSFLTLRRTSGPTEGRNNRRLEKKALTGDSRFALLMEYHSGDGIKVG